MRKGNENELLLRSDQQAYFGSSKGLRSQSLGVAGKITLSICGVGLALILALSLTKSSQDHVQLSVRINPSTRSGQYATGHQQKHVLRSRVKMAAQKPRVTKKEIASGVALGSLGLAKPALAREWPDAPDLYTESGSEYMNQESIQRPPGLMNDPRAAMTDQYAQEGNQYLEYNRRYDAGLEDLPPVDVNLDEVAVGFYGLLALPIVLGTFLLIATAGRQAGQIEDGLYEQKVKAEEKKVRDEKIARLFPDQNRQPTPQPTVDENKDPREDDPAPDVEDISSMLGEEIRRRNMDQGNQETGSSRPGNTYNDVEMGPRPEDHPVFGPIIKFINNSKAEMEKNVDRQPRAPPIYPLDPRDTNRKTPNGQTVDPDNDETLAGFPRRARGLLQLGFGFGTSFGGYLAAGSIVLFIVVYAVFGELFIHGGTAPSSMAYPPYN